MPAFCVRSSKPYRFKSCHQLPDKKVEEKMSWKKWVECDTDENFKDDQGFFTVFPAIMFRFEHESQIFASKCIFSSILILFTLIYCIKGYPTKLKYSLFEVFKLLGCFHTKWGKFRFLVAEYSVHGFLRFLVCDI
jgi:hypothetical protein